LTINREQVGRGKDRTWGTANQNDWPCS